MTDEKALTCQELVEIITDYLENRLPQTERARFEAHLVGCSGCRNYLDQMRRTVKLLGTLSEEDIAPQTQEALLTAFRTWKAGPQAPD